MAHASLGLALASFVQSALFSVDEVLLSLGLGNSYKKFLLSLATSLWSSQSLMTLASHLEFSWWPRVAFNQHQAKGDRTWSC